MRLVEKRVDRTCKAFPPEARRKKGASTGRAVPDDFGRNHYELSIAPWPKHRQGGQPRRARTEERPLTT